MSTPPKNPKNRVLAKRAVPIQRDPLPPISETAPDLAHLERQMARRETAVVTDAELQLKIMARARG